MCSESSLLSAEEPSSYSLAAKQKVWRDAMQEEISAILKNKTWTMVNLRRDNIPIGVKSVFQVNMHCMLVVKGYTQKHGIDYDEVISLVARLESIRIQISIAAQENWELHHLDVKTAFLNG